MTPEGNIQRVIDSLHNRKGEAINVAPGNGHIVYIPLSEEISLSFAILLRNLANNTDTRNPNL